MDKLWAPWRIRYILKHAKAGCVFCKAYNSNHDKKYFIISRSKHCFSILNTFPYNNGHLMIIPNRHIALLEKLTTQEFFDMHETLTKTVKVLKKVLKAQGFNIGMNIGKVAGAGIEKHLHIHVVPRWLGDTNFMPVITGTKIISQSLEQLYSQLKKNI